MVNKETGLIIKAVCYITILITIAYFMFRVAIPFTLGMPSDLVVLAIPLLVGGTIVGLFYLGSIFFNDFTSKKDQ